MLASAWRLWLCGFLGIWITAAVGAIAVAWKRMPSVSPTHQLGFVLVVSGGLAFVLMLPWLLRAIIQ